MNNMITLSFSVWELALLIIAVAFIFGTVYLIKAFKNLADTLHTMNKVMEENRESIHNIVGDAEEMTERANGMTVEIQDTVNSMKKDVVDPLMEALSKVAKVAKVLSKKKKEKKIRKV